MSIDPKFESTLTSEEFEWLQTHQGDTFTIGLDPIAGMEYFKADGTEQGYLVNVVALLSNKLGIELKIRPELSWNESVEGLASGEIQVLFGANPTEERLKTMSFTDPIYSVPYTVLSRIDGVVQNIGDMSGKQVGYLEGDAVVQLFIEAYPNLKAPARFYDSQSEALSALNRREIDAFITSGGDVVYDYLFSYPKLKVVANLEEIRSLMTFSSLKVNQNLIDILSKAIVSYNADLIDMIDEARNQYIRKILNLTVEEKDWLRLNPTIKVGVPTDYMPIDYYLDGKYNGIAGHYLNTFADLIGIEIIAVPGRFDAVYDMINKGEIDVLNMAKTKERLDQFVFTDAFSNERDLIYGHRDKPYVHDIYGLEGKNVAVIEGFWHIDHLKMNLRKPQLVIVADIQEAIEAVETGKADYFIETPAVAEYYIAGMGYTDVIKKGETSSDSFLYFGMLKAHAPLVSLFNRAKLLIDYDTSKYLGVVNLPEVANVTNKKLGMMLFGVSCFIVILMILVLKLQRDLFLTKAREKLIYMDPLTGIYNRNYFNLIEKDVDQRPFPQNIFIMDINNLKQVNDQFGHINGDRLIDAVSGIIIQMAETYGGTAIRMGGDEFILCFFGIQSVEMDEVFMRLKEAFEKVGLYEQDKQLLENLQVAIGYSNRIDAYKTYEQCFKEADAAMYLNKATMKEEVEVY
jgi:diguanylate cyclase (GGDEF)-like protein